MRQIPPKPIAPSDPPAGRFVIEVNHDHPGYREPHLWHFNWRHYAFFWIALFFALLITGYMLWVGMR